MLELFGTVAGNVLSLPGVLGLALGLLTRRTGLATILGGLVGLAETMIFAGFSFANVVGLELAISVGVGIVAGALGSAIRRRGVAA